MVKCDHHEGHHGDAESVQSALNATQNSYQHAKDHVDHMVGLVNQQTHDQIVTIIKDETKKLATGLSHLSTELDNKLKTGEHSAQIKDAVNAAHTHLNEASAKLNQLTGDDIAAWNTQYFSSVSSALQELHNVANAGACPDIDPIVIKGSHDITHLFNDYQDKFHAAVGAHDAGAGDPHHEQGVHHHLHHHHQPHAAGHKSSEESAETSESGHAHHH